MLEYMVNESSLSVEATAVVPFNNALMASVISLIVGLIVVVFIVALLRFKQLNAVHGQLGLN